MAHIGQRLLQEGGCYGDKKWHGSFNQVFHSVEVCHLDNNGNRYEIFSEYGILNQGSNLILMEKVNAIVYLSNDEKVLILDDLIATG